MDGLKYTRALSPHPWLPHVLCRSIHKMSFDAGLDATAMG